MVTPNHEAAHVAMTTEDSPITNRGAAAELPWAATSGNHLMFIVPSTNVEWVASVVKGKLNDVERVQDLPPAGSRHCTARQ